MIKRFVWLAVLLLSAPSLADDLGAAVLRDYDDYLAELFDHFHRNPELSTVEFKTAERMAAELRAAGFEVTEKVGGTGIVAMLENGAGPLVMMRADMDGLPVEEKSGLDNASRAQQKDPLTGNEVFTMHACGHDVHITSLVGTARQMAARKDEWNGTLMLVVQPAEERGIGARSMRNDRIWERFGQPDYALAFHVSSSGVAGVINVSEGSPYAGADSVDIIIHGVGAHGASPHRGKDPIVLGSQIVLALQTLVARELSPREPGVVTVGSFHSGTKHNIISDSAHLQLTVRNTNEETRTLLLNGIRRIAENMGRVAGLPEDMLPEVIVSDETCRHPDSTTRHLPQDSARPGPKRSVPRPSSITANRHGWRGFSVTSRSNRRSRAFTGALAAHRRRTLRARGQAVRPVRAITRRCSRSHRNRRFGPASSRPSSR